MQKWWLWHNLIEELGPLLPNQRVYPVTTTKWGNVTNGFGMNLGKAVPMDVAARQLPNTQDPRNLTLEIEHGEHEPGAHVTLIGYHCWNIPPWQCELDMSHPLSKLTRMDVQFQEPLNGSDYLEMDLIVHIPLYHNIWHVKCPVCGNICKVIQGGLTWSTQMPDCPIPDGVWRFELPSKMMENRHMVSLPVHGWLDWNGRITRSNGSRVATWDTVASWVSR